MDIVQTPTQSAHFTRWNPRVMCGVECQGGVWCGMLWYVGDKGLSAAARYTGDWRSCQFVLVWQS